MRKFLLFLLVASIYAVSVEAQGWCTCWYDWAGGEICRTEIYNCDPGYTCPCEAYFTGDPTNCENVNPFCVPEFSTFTGAAALGLSMGIPAIRMRFRKKRSL